MRGSVKSVCIVSQSLYEFDARVKRKAEALAAAGYDVDVLTLRTAPAQKTHVRNGVTIHTISLGKRRSSLPRYFFEYVVFFAWAFTRVTLLTWRKRYSVIDVNTLPDFLVFAAILARWMGAKVVLDMHEITPEFYRSKYGIAEDAWLVSILTFLERVSFNFADRVMTVNEPILNLLVSRGLPRQKSTVLMNAADEARFANPSTSPEIAMSRPAASPAFAMLYHGTLTRIYGLDIAIEAFALAEKDMPGAELWIIGLGPEQQALRQQAEQRGLSARVKVLGPVPSDEIGDWLRRCDAGILPMRRDVFLDFAFPNKLSEFIVSRRPVLVSRLRTMKHYFSEQALAYFEPNTPRDLAKQMIRLYRDRGRRVRLAARAAEEYAPIRWEVMRERYLQLIAELAGAECRATESAVQPAIAAR
jgi:glycosyltransferase involved in cell wall biosynthesis